MHQRTSKKIIIYVFIFLLVGTLNNKKISSLTLPKIEKIEISGLNDYENKELSQNLNMFKNLNILLLEKKLISDIIRSNSIIEKFSIYKNYPSNLIIDIKKSKLLAYTKKDNSFFYIASNGNLIKTNNSQINLPFIFGNIEIREFLKLKNVIDKSSFNYDNIKNLYYYKSKRWDIETKDNLIIKLPSKNLELSFEMIFKIFDKEEFVSPKIIDLRQNNQVILNG